MLMAGRMHPPFLFCRAKRETGRARSKEKSVGALRCSGPPRDGGRRIGASADLARPSGTLYSSAISPTAVPWRIVRRSAGWSSHGAASLFLSRATALRGFPSSVFHWFLLPRVRLRYALPWRSWKLQLGPMLKLSLTTGQRQRKSAQRVSRTSPGWRGSQGPDVSLSDRRKGSPTFPRRNVLSFPPGAVSPTAPVRRSTSVPSKSPHHEQDKKECILWQST